MLNSILVLAIGISVGIASYDGAVKLGKYLNMKMVKQSLSDLPPFILSENGVDTGSVTLIRIHNEDGEFVCSGTIVSTKYVLTAAHCISDEDGNLSTETYKIHVLIGDGSIVVIEAKAASLNHRSDNGLMLGDFTGLSTVKLALGPLNSLQRSQTVLVCGFPYGSLDDICYFLESASKQYYFQMAAKGHLYPGMSGGPVYDMENNVVVGVNSAVGNGYIITTNLVGLFESLKVEVRE